MLKSTEELSGASADEIFDSAVETISQISRRIAVARLAVAAFYQPDAVALGHVKVSPSDAISICSALGGIEGDLTWQINELEHAKMIMDEKRRSSKSADSEN